MRALTPAVEHPVGSGRRPVETPDVETVRRTTATLRTLDNEFGGGAIREIAVRFLDADVAPLLQDGHFGEPVGPALLSATAELTRVAGWAAYDVGLQGLAQRYLIQNGHADTMDANPCRSPLIGDVAFPLTPNNANTNERGRAQAFVRGFRGDSNRIDKLKAPTGVLAGQGLISVELRGFEPLTPSYRQSRS
jgi:hypothetical protein